MPELIQSLPEQEKEFRDDVLIELNANRLWHKTMGDETKALAHKMDENTLLTQEIVDIMRAGQGGLKVLNWLGKGLAWCAGVAGSIYTLYCIITGKNPLS